MEFPIGNRPKDFASSNWLCFSALNHRIILISEAKPKAIFFSVVTHTNVERQH